MLGPPAALCVQVLSGPWMGQAGVQITRLYHIAGSPGAQLLCTSVQICPHWGALQFPPPHWDCNYTFLRVLFCFIDGETEAP